MLLFAGPDYGADPGWKCYVGYFESLEKAEAFLQSSIEDWAHIVKDYQIIAEFRRTDGGWERVEQHSA